MPRPCSSCNKLASLETQEPEIQDESLSGGTVTVSARVVRNSACCGDEMKEYTFELEDDVTSELEAHVNEKHKAEDGPEPDVDDFEFTLALGGAEITERMQDKDRHGKPIKSFRYRKSYIGVSVPYTVTCDTCSEEVASGTLTDEVQASAFDEL